MKVIKRIITRHVKLVAEPLKDGVKTAQGISTNIRTVITEIKSNRDPNAGDAPDLDDFTAILDHWEIEPPQIPRVIKGLKVRIISFGILGLYGLYLLIIGINQNKLLSLIAGISLFSLGITAFVTGLWRIRVLEEKKFIPFGQWIKTLFN